MEHVVVAFEVVGNAPINGGYLSRVIACRVSGTSMQTNRFELISESSSPSDQSSFSASFDGFLRFVGCASVVTHDGYNWKRFVRHALRDRSSGEVKAFLARTVDVSEWSATAFPRQRKDLVSILKRLNIALNPNLTGIERDLAAVSSLLTWVMPLESAKEIRPPRAEKLRMEQAHPMTDIQTAVALVSQAKLPFRQRVVSAWRILLGKPAVESAHADSASNVTGA
jgi:hypothetical protein